MRARLLALAMDAARRGDAAALRELFAKEEVRAPQGSGVRGGTPLMAAARRGFAECVRAILESGAGLGERDARRFSALCYAAEGGSAECAVLLMEAGADPNEDGYLEPPAWAVAAEEGSLEVLKAMERFGWSPKARSGHSGMTALMQAAAGGAGGVELIAWLCDRGATLEARSHDGWTAGMVAAARGREEALAELIRRGESQEWEDDRRRSALHWACQAGEAGCAKRLAEAGWDPRKEDDEGITPMDLSSPEMKELLESIREELELGSGVPQADRSGRGRGL